MTRFELLDRVKARKENVGITIDNLSKVSELGSKTLSRFFAGHDVKLSTVEKVTEVLGLDLAGNEVIDIKTLKDNRAEEKARYIVGLVQDTSSLEMQGLDKKHIDEMIYETKMMLLYGDYRNKLWAS